MAYVSLHVIDGVDKGRSFLNLSTPVTIGREEGNSVRLNDERVSRFHAKVQVDQGEIVLTDLDSTNGTRVNGETVQLRLLRPGDRLSVGRSTILFGDLDEIRREGLNERAKREREEAAFTRLDEAREGLPTELASSHAELDESFDVFERTPPRLPSTLSPAQAAQISEVIDFLHRALADAIDPVVIGQKAKEAQLPLESWQRVQTVLTYLAQYSRRIASPGDEVQDLA